MARSGLTGRERERERFGSVIVQVMEGKVPRRDLPSRSSSSVHTTDTAVK